MLVTILIVLALAAVVIIAVKNAGKRLSGQGGCCGGGGDEFIDDKKVLDHPEIAEKKVNIQGMHCEQCERHIQRQLNRIDGLSAEVNWKKGEALVKMDREIKDDLIKRTIERLDYHVTDIQTVQRS
ncbi:heavy-metal-associated domain-containing protein [Pseudoramibacter sp.]|jgi:copper chaperone CopZ|uniref:heavy-metal-associated domain-containing protein n=1 Tax=Pseudoramibacter sp. TaxID=2034862 RepID=UPI0025E62E5D|nr:heavy metal-associated domain-containing protein [Pseudoramibacter sp.]MCH4072975.1 cation transporter [Pseudoramibacter sp.]MCH4106746.1 cation transporter [Pseudoramibacter sp.]